MRLMLRNEGAKSLVFSFFNSLSCSILAFSFLTGCFSREQAVLDKPVVTINGKAVSTKEFAERLALRLKNYDALYAKEEANLARAKEETIRAYLLESIVRQYADQNKLQVTSQEIDALVADIKSKYPDDFAFRRALADQNMPLEKWREDLQFTLLQKKVFSSVTKTVPIPEDSEIKSYYESHKPEFQRAARVRLRQVVLEKEDDAKRMLEELSGGAALEELARKFSIAPESKNGGDTGWIEKGTLEVFDQAFKMPIGARSRLLKSPYGWHIFEVLKKEPEARLSFESAKDRIRAQLLEVNTQKVFSTWLEEQVRKSSVKRDDTVLRSIKVSTRGS